MFRLTGGHGPCAVGHSRTPLCASQDIGSGRSEELEKWVGDIRGYRDRRKEKARGDYCGGGAGIERQGWSRGAGSRGRGGRWKVG